MELPSIETTVELMKRLHSGQTDKAGEPYWGHPLRVMRRLGDDASMEAKLIALLHDTIEDCGISPAYLLDLGYGPRVTMGVVNITKPKNTKSTYAGWIAYVAMIGFPDDIRVKIADIEDNSDPARLAKLTREARDTLLEKYQPALVTLRTALEGKLRKQARTT